MEFTIIEIRDIYWSIRSYSQLLKDVNVTTYEPLDKITEKIWKNLTEEQKEKIDIDRYAREAWLKDD